MNDELIQRLAAEAGFKQDPDNGILWDQGNPDGWGGEYIGFKGLVRFAALVAEEAAKEVLALHPTYVQDSACRGTLDRCAYVIRTKFKEPD